RHLINIDIVKTVAIVLSVNKLVLHCKDSCYCMSVKTICTKKLVFLVYYKSSCHSRICSFVIIAMTHHTWSAPFTCTISGPKGSGKSVFVQLLLKHAKTVIEPRPERILYCYGVYQTIFSQFGDVQFNEGLPSLDEFKGDKHSLV